MVKEKKKVKTVSVSEALRLDSGYYAIRGVITLVTEVYHMVKGSSAKCNNCGAINEGRQYNPMISYGQFRAKRPIECINCESKLDLEPINIPAITIEIRNPDSSNDLEGIKIVLFGKDTNGVVAGEHVFAVGDIVVTEHKGKGFSSIYAKKVKYEVREEVKLSLDDAVEIEKFVESRQDKKTLIGELVNQCAIFCQRQSKTPKIEHEITSISLY